VVGVLNNIRENIILIGMLSVHLLQTLLHPKSVRWQDFMKTMEDIGPNALPLIVLIGFLVGLITAFQAAIPLGRFGAQIYIADLVGLTLVKEMAPLMTAVLLAGRTASAYAAEIGSMKINQEIDALTTMGLDPVKFLTIPRILAATIMTPILSLFLLFFGLVGCGVVMQSLGYNYDIYIHQLESAIQLKDFLGGFIKTFVFGIVIAGIGCLHGLKTRFGASAVGYSTTQAVVSSIIMIVIIDGIFACVYYVLGI
jgi:phospholipid/cholesterol/gamma-HCH transport system permease protein